MNENTETKVKDNNSDTTQKFWEKKNFWLVFFIALLIFGVFFFTSLGAYTKRDVGLTMASAMGETLFASKTTDWFLPLNNAFIGLMILLPIGFYFYKKFTNKNETINTLKVIRNGYFLIFAYTIVIFSFEAVSLIAFANNILAVKIDLSGAQMTNFQASDVVIDLTNKSEVNLTFAILYFIGVFALFIGTIFYVLTHNKFKNFNDYEDIFRMTAIILVGLTMFQLMMAAFGAGALGINSKFYSSITMIDFDGTSYSSLADWYNASGFLIHNVIGDYAELFTSTFASKSSFWGANNNWPGYLIFSLLIVGTVYSIYYLINNLSKVKKGTYESNTNLFEALVAFVLVVFAFYFVDRYIIVFIDQGNWNPNLFNGLIYKTAESDYYGTVYFWIVIFLLPLLSFGSFFYVYRPARENIVNKLLFLKSIVKSDKKTKDKKE